MLGLYVQLEDTKHACTLDTCYTQTHAHTRWMPTH